MKRIFTILVLLITLSSCTGYNIIEQVEAKPIKYDNIRQVLRMDNCRVVQKEEEHILKDNGSVYAQDIACDKGKKVEAKAPKWKDKYVVVRNGWDNRMGNYIVLKHGEYLFVYGHIKSDLRVGSKIKSGTHIGYSNNSGMSLNHHLHFELWKNGYNISLKEITEGKTIFNMEKTYALRNQRHWKLETDEAIDFITDFEGFMACAKWDGKQYSNGYSTRAKSPTECISSSVAKKRIRAKVEYITQVVYSQHFVKYPNQRVALISALYNLGEGSSIVEVKNLKTEKSIEKHFVKFVNATNIKTGEKKKLNGLVKRRSIEASKYLNKI